MNKKKIINNLNPLFFKGICHRGYHNSKDTENGLKAFENALNVQMAIELDVHLTKDDQLIVVHDSELERVTSKKGIVEDLTLKEIKDNYSLLDGEKLPTLKEVFDLVKERVPIVIELKVYNRNYKPLAKRLKQDLSQVKDKKNFMLISFDPRALFPFKNSGFIRQLLVAHDGKHEYVYAFRHFFEGVDLEYTFLKMRKIQKYSKKHVINIWTVEDKEIAKESLPYVDTITFQNMDCNDIKELLKEKNKDLFKQ